MKRAGNGLGRLLGRGGPILSSPSFLRAALAICLFYGLLVALGVDRYACIIVMTSPSGQAPGTLDVALGGLFIITYALVILAAPPLLIASALLAIFETRLTSRAEPPPSEPASPPR